MVVVLLGSKWPVDQEQINVIQLELLQGVVDGPSDILWCVEVLPHLGSDEELLALDLWVFAQELLDAGSDLILIQVEPGAVEVTIAGLESGDDGAVCLSWGADAGEGAKAEGWHLLAGVESDHWGVGHVV